MLRSPILPWALLFAAAAGCQAVSSMLASDLPLKAGNTIDGQQTGVWRYYHGRDGVRDGLYARGRYDHDKPDGEWTYFYPRTDAQRAAGDDGTKRWDVSFAKRAFEGPTTFYHPGGGVLAQGQYHDGLEVGTWSFFEPDGTKVQEGTFTNGRRTGLWRYWDGEGHPVAEGPRDGSRHVGGWRFWLSDGADYTYDFTQPAGMNEGGRRPSDDLLAKLDQRPPIPMLPQPGLTMVEEELRDYFVDLYTVGRDHAEKPKEDVFASQTPNYGPAAAGKRKFQNKLKSDGLIGTELPRRYLADQTGSSVDLLDATTRDHWSLLVILRGQKNEVCIYCMAQTESLALTRPEFDRRGVEITVVYPGAIERLSAFRELFEREFRDDPDLRFVYDEDFALVEGLGIQDEFATPTTLLLDGEGVIRYAYVGNDIDDRPAANQLLEKIDELRAR